jgi:hypothetical protein
MNMILAVLAGAIGLLVTASGIVMAWLMMQQPKSKSVQETSPRSYQPALSGYLLKWTFFDYALIVIFIIGSLFLFADILAVLRDTQSYPLYHYGYLLCGFVFTLFGMLFMVLRLVTVLSLVRTQILFPAPNEDDHPDQAERSKKRIQSGQERFEAELAD